MGLELVLPIIAFLLIFASVDLIVGIGNDAANFMNAAVGSRAAPRYVVMTVASLGIFAGVTFSSGMMEIARKGVFHPEFFTLPELLVLFAAVMIADIILLDLFITFGLPTSTTVSIVFELLGSAVAVSIWKIKKQNGDFALLGQYINTNKAITMILGILLSILIAFVAGTIIQFMTRMIFTFDYRARMKRYGAIWGGIALSFIAYFILIRGARGAVFVTQERLAWIESNTMTILFFMAVASGFILQCLLFFKVNVFKPIILVGTFAIAMSFAANDLVNFIGVPLAGFHALKIARSLPNPMTATMELLGNPFQTEWYLLIGAGAIMVVTLWFSSKARALSRTELGLSSQSERFEHAESTFLARTIVRMSISFIDTIKFILPDSLLQKAARRLDTTEVEANGTLTRQHSFDLVRASVNLMVSSVIISYATSNKLPLSTTYVTFMVAMGSSFADRAWGRASAVYRVTGVLTVIGGWFMTALLASSFAFAFASTLFNFKFFGLAQLLLLAALVLWKNHRHHVKKESSFEENQIFNLGTVSSADAVVPTIFHQMSYLHQEIRLSLDSTLAALFKQQEIALNEERRNVKKIQSWVNIISANVFEALRLLQKENALYSYEYSQTVRCLQKLSDGHRDIVARAHKHVSNQHEGFTAVQIEDLNKVKNQVDQVFESAIAAFSSKRKVDSDKLLHKYSELQKLAKTLNGLEVERIWSGQSKTQLSILFFAVLGNFLMVTKQILRLLKIFNTFFEPTPPRDVPDLE
ncbi:MAG: inorganic phosphate transporter [bacterium]